MFRTLIVGLAVIIGFSPAVMADGWTKTADMALNLNQTSYSDSWKGGEAGSITWTLIGNMTAQKQINPKYNWLNTLKVSYGQTHNQMEDGFGDLKWQSPEKSSDRVFFESLLRMTLGKWVDPYASLTLDSQFDDQSIPEVPRLFNPITLTEAAGVGRMIRQNEQSELFSRLGLAVRQHISRDVITIDPEETKGNTTHDAGLELVTDYKQVFGEGNLKYVSKLRLFQALYNSESDDLKGLDNEDDWKTVDVAWENTLSASVVKYIQVSLFCELLYDKEIDPRGRFREVLGLGVTYKLF